MMKVETDNLRTVKEIADNYLGRKGKGVSKTYIYNNLREYIIEIRGFSFIDITKLPKEIKEKIDL